MISERMNERFSAVHFKAIRYKIKHFISPVRKKQRFVIAKYYVKGVWTLFKPCDQKTIVCFTAAVRQDSLWNQTCQYSQKRKFTFF